MCRDHRHLLFGMFFPAGAIKYNEASITAVAISPG